MVSHLHAHGHLEGEANHQHGISREGQQRRLRIVLLIALLFSGIEALGGWYSGSLALLADAGHMIADSGALALSSLSVWLAGREASSTRTYGFRRAELLAAVINACLLVAASGWIVFEALERFSQPHAIQSGIMLWIAIIGLAANICALAVLHGPARENLSIKAAAWHIAADLMGSIGVVLAALILRWTGWLQADATVSLIIAVVIGVSGGKILLDSVNLLLDSVPKQIDTHAVRHYMAGLPEVRQICDLHIWAVSSSETLLTAHLVVDPEIDRDSFQRNLLRALHDQFHLAHMTIQLESNTQDTCPPGW
jgi:cobalt-zinc-cadmium efflux system protein